MLRIRFSPGGRYLAAVGGDGSVVVWSVAGWKFVRRLPGSTTHLAEIAFSGDDSILAVWRYTRQRGGQGHIRIWSTSNWEETRAFNERHQLDWMQISPDNATILFGAPWETRYARITIAAEPTIDDRRVRWSSTPISVCGFLPSGEALCVEPTSRALIAWDYRTRRYRSLWDWVQGVPVALSPDGLRSPRTTSCPYGISRQERNLCQRGDTALAGGCFRRTASGLLQGENPCDEWRFLNEVSSTNNLRPPQNRHSREGGNPARLGRSLYSRLRPNDGWDGTRFEVSHVVADRECGCPGFGFQPPAEPD